MMYRVMLTILPTLALLAAGYADAETSGEDIATVEIQESPPAVRNRERDRHKFKEAVAALRHEMEDADTTNKPDGDGEDGEDEAEEPK